MCGLHYKYFRKSANSRVKIPRFQQPDLSKEVIGLFPLGWLIKNLLYVPTMYKKSPGFTWNIA